MDDEDTRPLELEQNLKVPAPLDPHIASVTIRTGSNNPASYFDLLLSASFGAEHVTLEAGGDKIEVHLSIRKAEIRLDSVNCNLHLVSSSGSESWTGNERQDFSSGSRRGFEAAGNLHASGSDMPSGAAKAGVSYKADRAEEKISEVERRVLPWRVLSEDTISIGYLDDYSRTLHGRILDENISVRVSPADTTSRVGVLARLRVRERWIDIDETRPIAVSAKLSKLFQKLKSENEDSERIRTLFSRLLAHLVAVQLQDSSETRDATLAASAIVFSPVSEDFDGIAVPKPRATIPIDPTAVEAFIDAEEGQEEEVLRGLGVQLSDSSDEKKLRFTEKFLDVWQGSGNRGPIWHDVEVETISKAFSLTFGRHVEVSEKEANGHRNLCFRLSSEKHAKGDAGEIISLFPSTWVAHDILINLGILTKGAESLQLAKLFGFTKSYQTLRNRLRGISQPSGHGNLVALHDVFDAGGKADGISLLEGVSWDAIRLLHDDDLLFEVVKKS